MSKYDALKDWKDASPKEQLNAFIHEMRRPVSLIHGYAALVKKESGNAKGLADEFTVWTDNIIEAANDLNELLDIFSSFQQEV